MGVSDIDVVLKDLDKAFRQTVDIADELPDDDWTTQYHKDLSPIAWHVGHTVFIESYWIREELLQIPLSNKERKELYLPWLNDKKDRARLVPKKKELLVQVAASHQENMALLGKALLSHKDHKLLLDNYLPLFLIQHYCQHQETMGQILLQREIRKHDGAYNPGKTISPTDSKQPGLVFEQTNSMIGCPRSPLTYDNESPIHQVDLPAYQIASLAVSNSEYLGFMISNGYHQKEFWSREGWRWLENTGVSSPIHWRKQNKAEWYQCDIEGPQDLSGKEPVSGISFYEAQAYAVYANARLPDETEWEHAIKNNESLTQSTGKVWEWCGNTFYAYPGYKAFPYDQYSRPWFDGRHYTLKGGSTYTRNWIKRPTFRNFYTADARHIFAGIRLAQSS